MSYLASVNGGDDFVVSDMDELYELRELFPDADIYYSADGFTWEWLA